MVKLKYSEENLFLGNFVHHSSHMNQYSKKKYEIEKRAITFCVT